MYLTSFFILFFLLFPITSSVASPPSNKLLERIAFGSCNMQRFKQPHWRVIRAQKPQLWIWGGDIIYSDLLNPPVKKIPEYKRLLNLADYQLLSQEATILGTWDDHDYAYNNSGANYLYKKESQQVLLDFLGISKTDRRRTQEGVYHSQTFGPPGKQVKVILLDLRYFRDYEGPFSDLLGDAQWIWFERELLESPAELTLVMSSSQVFPQNTGADTWGNYPKERDRLVKLLEQSTRPIVFLSGDRHFAEISELRLEDGRVFTEFTSSGLTHSSLLRGIPPNPARVSPVLMAKNFGTIQLDWKVPGELWISLEIRNIDGSLYHRQFLRYDL